MKLPIETLLRSLEHINDGLCIRLYDNVLPFLIYHQLNRIQDHLCLHHLCIDSFTDCITSRYYSSLPISSYDTSASIVCCSFPDTITIYFNDSPCWLSPMGSSAWHTSGDTVLHLPYCTPAFFRKFTRCFDCCLKFRVLPVMHSLTPFLPYLPGQCISL